MKKTWWVAIVVVVFVLYGGVGCMKRRFLVLLLPNRMRKVPVHTLTASGLACLKWRAAFIAGCGIAWASQSAQRRIALWLETCCTCHL